MTFNPEEGGEGGLSFTNEQEFSPTRVLSLQITADIHNDVEAQNLLLDESVCFFHVCSGGFQ